MWKKVLWALQFKNTISKEEANFITHIIQVPSKGHCGR